MLRVLQQHIGLTFPTVHASHCRPSSPCQYTSNFCCPPRRSRPARQSSPRPIGKPPSAKRLCAPGPPLRLRAPPGAITFGSDCIYFGGGGEPRGRKLSPRVLALGRRVRARPLPGNGTPRAGSDWPRAVLARGFSLFPSRPRAPGAAVLLNPVCANQVPHSARH